MMSWKVGGRKRSWSVLKRCPFSYLEWHIKARISGLRHPEFETEISRIGRRSFNHYTATILGKVSNNPVEKYCYFYRVPDHVSCHGVSRRKRAFYSVKLPLSRAGHAGHLNVYVTDELPYLSRKAMRNTVLLMLVVMTMMTWWYIFFFLYLQQTDIHAPGRIRTHDLSRRVAVDLRHRPRGHWDRHLMINTE